MVEKLLRLQQNCKERIEQHKGHLTVSNHHSYNSKIQATLKSRVAV